MSDLIHCCQCINKYMMVITSCIEAGISFHGYAAVVGLENGWHW
jgi:hypothetical protein